MPKLTHPSPDLALDTCACGHCFSHPNRDCERCQFVQELHAARTTLAKVRLIAQRHCNPGVNIGAHALAIAILTEVGNA